MSIFVDVNSLPKPYPQVIKVDGQCYQIVGGTEQAADTFAIEGEFEDCDDCKADVSYSSSSSQGQSSSSSSEGISSSSSQGFSSSSSSLSVENSSSSSQSAVANACAGVTCPTVNSNANPPSMQLTITAPDGDLPIIWCGFTWLKSTTPKSSTPSIAEKQRYSGDSACVCPSTYILPVAYANQNHWGGPGGELNLFHSTQFGFIALRRVDMSPTNFASSAKSVCVGTQNNCADTSTGVFAGSPVRGCLPKAAPGSGVTNAFIEDCQFFSHTVSGVKYEWEKGLNWP